MLELGVCTSTVLASSLRFLPKISAIASSDVTFRKTKWFYSHFIYAFTNTEKQRNPTVSYEHAWPSIASEMHRGHLHGAEPGDQIKSWPPPTPWATPACCLALWN